jgi:hypothetical protein
MHHRLLPYQEVCSLYCTALISYYKLENLLIILICSETLGSNLAISVNRVNSWRKFKGGLGPANLENDIV